MPFHFLVPIWISFSVKYLLRLVPIFLLGLCLFLTDLCRSLKKYINNSPLVSYYNITYVFSPSVTCLFIFFIMHIYRENYKTLLRTIGKGVCASLVAQMVKNLPAMQET